jgi:hypothetical protein
VSSFQQIFSRPEADNQPEIEERPEWSGPPDGEVGVAVPLSLVVGRSARAAVALRSATAYTTGAILDFYAVVRGMTSRNMTMLFHNQHLAEPEVTNEFLRLGIEVADGERVSNLGNPRMHSWKPGVTPEGPILLSQGGSSGGSGPGRVTFDQAYWLWPLPPPGPLRVFAEWPAFEIELSSVDLDAGALLEAAKRSRRLWDD